MFIAGVNRGQSWSISGSFGTLSGEDDLADMFEAFDVFEGGEGVMGDDDDAVSVEADDVKLDGSGLGVEVEGVSGGVGEFLGDGGRMPTVGPTRV